MDDLGELMVLGGLFWFLFDDDRLKLDTWPFILGLIIVGASLYFIDRALSRQRR